MDRQIVYPGQILPETSLLQMAKDAMIGSAKLAAAMLGTSTIANGFAVTPTGPASLQIVVAPGEIYAMANIDSMAFSTLPADTTHSILKQGIMLDGVTLSCPAPTTTGQSINYLVQVTYQDQDSTPVLLPYYNSTNPALPFSGMGNNGLPQNTIRKGSAIVAVKAGASATTGSQVTPAPDVGYVGLYVVTVDYGQTTITSSRIAQYGSAKLLPSGIVQSMQNGNTLSALDTGTANTYSCTYTPAITERSEQQVLRFKVKTSNTDASTFNDGLGAVALVGGAHSALQGGELIANGDAWVQWNTSIGGGSYILLFCTGAAEQVAPATQSKHAVQQSQLGNYNSFGYISVSTSMTSAYLGKEYVVQGGAVQTLPPVSVAPAGSTINLIIYTATQIKGNGAELITMISGATSSNTINVNPGEQIQFASNGLSWYIANYSLNAQYQLNTAFTTAGTAGALTLTPVPAIQAYKTPLRFRVKFSQNSTGTDAINVSGQGDKSIKQYDSTGAKVAAVFAASQLADVEYDGTDFVLLDQLPASASTGVIGTARNLKMAVTAASATATLTADEIVLGVALGGAQIKVASFSKTINLATTGAGGMDTGTAPVSGYVAIYAIYNPTTLASALLGVNATSSAAPSIYGGANMPAGYTASALVSVWGTNASGQLRVGYQSDRNINFVAVSVLTSTAAASTFTSVNISSAAPLNAVSVVGVAGMNSNSGALNATIASDATTGGVGLQQATASAVTNLSANYNLIIATAQRIYYMFSATGSSANINIFVSGYTI